METEVQQPRVAPKKRRRLRKLIIWLIVLACLGGLGYIVVQMLMGPAEGTVMNVRPDTQATAEPEVQLEQFDGTNFTFAHPDSYTLRPAKAGESNNPNSLESYNFVMPGMISKLLTVTVTNLPSGRLEDDSSYYMRSLHPETYAIKPQVIQGEKVAVVLDTKNYQQAAFWAHGAAGKTKLLTFTINSISMDTGSTGQEYQKMLESVHWR